MTPYVGELRMFAGSYAPQGWALCNGQLLQISQYDILFNVIGTTYGGDGETTFGVPDLRGRAPIHVGPGFSQGQMAGEEYVTLTGTGLPAHTHAMQGSQNPATGSTPQGGVLASLTTASTFAYGNDPPIRAIDPSSIGAIGGSQAHENRQPFVCITWIIAVAGIYPPHS